MIRMLRAALEHLSIYLPIILMGVLALGTYWLVRSTPVFTPPSADQSLRHEHDYLALNFSVKTFDATGQLKNEIFGSEARHFPDTDTMEIERFRIRNFNEKGHLTTASSNRAIVNSDGSEIQLFGNAQVLRDAVVDKDGTINPRMSYRSEFLHAYLDTERVKSHKPVELIRGDDQFTADSLEFDNVDQVLQLHGRVHGTLVRKAKP